MIFIIFVYYLINDLLLTLGELDYCKSVKCIILVNF